MYQQTDHVYFDSDLARFIILKRLSMNAQTL